YGSEMYWLLPLFQPSGVGVTGTNFLNYENDGALMAQFQQINVRCEFKEVQKCNHVLHGMFFDKMPFIPLWQLDTFAVLHQNRQPVLFDPLLVSPDAGRWTLEKKCHRPAAGLDPVGEAARFAIRGPGRSEPLRLRG